MIKISEIEKQVPTNFICPLEEEVFQILEKLKIQYEYVTNDVVETMDECVDIDKKLECEIRKSILLTNKKHTTFFLVVLPAKKSLDVHQLEAKIGISGLCFATADDMEKRLGVQPGSLTVLSVVRDLDDYVQVILDKEIEDSPNFSSNTGTNRRHLKIKTTDLMRYLKEVHHRPRVIPFS